MILEKDLAMKIKIMAVILFFTLIYIHADDSPDILIGVGSTYNTQDVYSNHSNLIPLTLHTQFLSRSNVFLDVQALIGYTYYTHGFSGDPSNPDNWTGPGIGMISENQWGYINSSIIDASIGKYFGNTIKIGIGIGPSFQILSNIIFNGVAPGYDWDDMDKYLIEYLGNEVNHYDWGLNVGLNLFCSISYTWTIFNINLSARYSRISFPEIVNLHQFSKNYLFEPWQFTFSTNLSLFRSLNF